MVGGAAVAFDFAVPAVFGGVVCEVVFQSVSGPQPWGVGGCGDELGAGEVEVALAGVICPAFFGPSDCVLLTLLPASLPTL